MERLLEFATNHIALVSTFVALLLALFFLDRKKAGATISPQQTVLLMNKDACVLVDIRDKKDYSTGHIKGSLHITLSAIKERHTELKKFEGKTIVLVDKMGQHSGAAGKLFKDLGYSDVLRMQGGISEWQGQNLPLISKS